MIDESKQTDNTAQPDNQTEAKQKITSEATTDTMNLNQDWTELNTQQGDAVNRANDSTKDKENVVAAAPSMSETQNQAVLSEKERQIESLKAQVEERSNQYMRIAADFENFRRRSQKEKEELEQQAKRNTILEVLPVIDNFERARSQFNNLQTDAEKNIHKSYQSVYKQLVDTLKRLGVSAMRPEGKEFDPNLHEAVMRESTHEYPEGTVTEELVRGYFLGDRVLRHALVKVAAAPEEAIPETAIAEPTEATES